MTKPTVLVVGSLHHDIMVEAITLPRRDETAAFHVLQTRGGHAGSPHARGRQAAQTACNNCISGYSQM